MSLSISTQNTVRGTIGISERRRRGPWSSTLVGEVAAVIHFLVLVLACARTRGCVHAQRHRVWHDVTVALLIGDPGTVPGSPALGLIVVTYMI